MGQYVYLLCALTSIFCAVLLIRSYLRSSSSLLLWSMICFACLALNNILLFVDYLMGPAYDLSAARSACSLVGFAVLLYGLVWDTV